jgi:hypothetical protein
VDGKRDQAEHHDGANDRTPDDEQILSAAASSSFLFAVFALKSSSFLLLAT